MMKHSTHRILLWTIAALMMQLSAACTADETVAYSHFEEIPSSGWDPVDILIFEPWPSDSAQAYRRSYSMDLVLRYSTRRHITMLPVALSIEDANGELRTDTLTLHPDSTDGSMSSRVRYGVHELRMTIDPSVRITDGYRVSLSPLSPREQNEGLLNVGLILK